jgi:hypothetical protein
VDILKLLNITQAVFGAIITCLAVNTFLNIDNFSTLSIEVQMNMVWVLVALSLLIYGVLQLVQGLTSMFNIELPGDKL